MSEAIFALAGTALGIIGTLAVDLIGYQREAHSLKKSALRAACVEFMAAIEQLRHLAYELHRDLSDEDLRSRTLETHMQARAAYERLRLTASSVRTQEAGRYVLRYAYGLLRLVHGRDRREDEQDKHPIQLLAEWHTVLLTEVRRELGFEDAESLYVEPREWMTFPGFKIADEASEAEQ